MENKNQEIKKKFYKRWWFWLIVVIILFIAIASSGNKPQKVGNTTNSGSQNTATKQDEVFKVGDQVKMGSSIVTINKVEYSQGGQYSKPTAGNEWLNLNITIENTGSTGQGVSTLGQMFIRDGDKNSYQVAVTNKAMENPGFGLDGQILANSKRTGWVGFEVPKTATGLQFQYNGSMFGGGNILINLDR